VGDLETVVSTNEAHRLASNSSTCFGHIITLIASTSLYMLSIHCMAHRKNLAFKIVSKFPSVSKVEDLV
jgi:hypothetical protein